MQRASSKIRLATLSLVALVASAAATCPAGTTQVGTFDVDDTQWAACEDLQIMGGGINLISPTGDKHEHYPKSYEPYTQGVDEEYYLGLGKASVLASKTDMLGNAILNCAKPVNGRCEPTWSAVESAVPVMRNSGGTRGAGWQCGAYSSGGGVRTFVGSRGAGVDATFRCLLLCAVELTAFLYVVITQIAVHSTMYCRAHCLSV